MSKEVFNEGPTTSQHVETDNDAFFKKTTFQLKRTRSVGLLDDFINQAHMIGKNDNNGGNDNTSGNSYGSGGNNGNSEIPHAGGSGKITSRDFISDATLKRLNIDPNSAQRAEGVSANSPYTADELNHVPSFYQHVIPSYKGKGLQNSQRSVQLTPKHQLRRQEMQQKQEQRMRQHNMELMASHVLHDDTDVEDQPKQHIDYLSHHWQAADEVLKCWRYVVLRKHDFADAARLENASWRTWAQTRNHLRTISPEDLNWSKDSDVTWLYGPALPDGGEKKQRPSAGDHSLSYSYGAEAAQPKSILKKRTDLENLIGDGSYSRLQSLLEEREHKFRGSPILEATIARAGGDTARTSGTATGGFAPLSLTGSDRQTSNSSASSRSSSSHFRRMTPSQLRIAQQRSSLKKQSKGGLALARKKPKRHVRFNTTVEQCIAVDAIDTDTDDGMEIPPALGAVPVNSPSSFHEGAEQSFNEYYNSKDNDNEDNSTSSSSSSSSSSRMDEDEPETPQPSGFSNYDTQDDGFIFGGTQKHSAETSPSVVHASGYKGPFLAIAPLPAATLNTGSDDEEDQKRTLYTVSHNTRTNRGYQYYYDYNRVYSDESSGSPMYSVLNDGDNDVQMVDVPAEVQESAAAQVVDVPESISRDLTETTDGVTTYSPIMVPAQRVVSADAPALRRPVRHRRASDSSRGTFVFDSEDSDDSYSSDSSASSDSSDSSSSSSGSYSSTDSDSSSVGSTRSHQAVSPAAQGPNTGRMTSPLVQSSATFGHSVNLSSSFLPDSTDDRYRASNTHHGA